MRILCILPILIFLTACSPPVENAQVEVTRIVPVVQTSAAPESSPEAAPSSSPTNEPSSTPPPTPTLTPTATETIAPVQTLVPLPLTSMTPFPTVTPDYTPYESKSIFLYFGSPGGDGVHPLASNSRWLVIYHDGHLIMESGEWPEEVYLETYLTPTEMCQLRDEIEASGLFEPRDEEEYYTQMELGEGASYEKFQLEDDLISLYTPNLQYLTDEVAAGTRIFTHYQPPQPLEPYSLTHLALLIVDHELLDYELEDDTKPITWPAELPPIEELLASNETSYVLLDEDLLIPIFDLFSRQLSWKYFQDGEKVYSILPYPLLPHETPHNYPVYPKIPRDYVSPLNCDGGAELISPSIPTAVPTITSSASRLSGKGRLLFVTYADDNAEIYVMEADGSNRLHLTNNLAYEWSPTWSPDGKLIAFLSGRDGDSEIFVMESDGTNVKQLTHNNTFDNSPSWSPDGSQIAFVHDRYSGPDVSEIYLMNADGSDQQRLTNNKFDDLNPFWSPDGRQIMFMQEIEYYKHYNLMSLDLSDENIVEGETELTFHNTNGDVPVWSPDGSMLAAARQTDNGDWEIQIMDPDMNVTQSFKVQDYYPDDLNWTYDGTFILFSGYGAGTENRDIFALDVTSGELIQITHSQQGESDLDLWP